LIYNDIERGMLFDVRRFFGHLADRLELVRITDLEEWFDFMDGVYEKGPAVVITDSLDALQVKADQKKEAKNKQARQAGEDHKGSYGTAKAKALSSRIREANNRLALHGSIMFLISQTRMRIGPGSQFDPKTKSGGLAPTFYAQLEMWTSVRENITKTVLGKSRHIGIVVKVKVKKNRQTGGVKVVEVPIYWKDVGLDDVGGCVDWLVEEKRWPITNGVIQATDLDLILRREDLIQEIESTDREKELSVTVAELWNEIEEGCAVKRKPRYP
jgi:RecA/RadA recombinase